MHNELPARVCATFGVPYFDLGGRCDVSAAINKDCKEAHSQCFTDLGLAPGWVNIMAEKYFRNDQEREDYPCSVEMYCGGLPAKGELDKCGPSRYALTWSAEGLENEYRDDCEVLVEGKLSSIPGMSTVVREQHVYSYEEDPVLVTVERFPTSGGLAHSAVLLRNRGVQEANYQTLRYPGHVAWVKENGCKDIPREKVKDVVFVGLFVKWKDNKETYVENKMVYGDSKFTAMQKCTAFPAVAAASLYNEMPGRPLTYADIPLDEFDRRVEDLFGLHDRSLEEPDV